MKIAIIGAEGFLGRRLMTILSKDHEVLGAGINGKEKIKNLDATDYLSVKKFLFDFKPSLVIDNVSLTSSLACEKDPKLAEELNYFSAKNIAKSCEEIGAKMVFFSSTYIFDGQKGDYTEKDTPSPLNEYGRTKVKAEKAVKEIEDYLIIRVDLMYGFNGQDLPNGIFAKILSNEQIVIRDLEQQRSPVYVDDVVKSIMTLAELNQRGIFHLTGGETISYFNLLKELEKAARFKTKIISLAPNKELSIKVPKLATLDNSKITKLGIKTNSLKDGIELLRKQVKAANLFQSL